MKANEVFNVEVKKLIFGAKEKAKLKTFIPNYMYVRIQEIGMDQKNDLSSIYLARYLNGEEKFRIFFECAIPIGAAYAIKNDIPIVLYDKDKKYSGA